MGGWGAGLGAQRRRLKPSGSSGPLGTHPACWAPARPQQARRGRLQPILQEGKLSLQGTETSARSGGQLGAWGHADLGSNVPNAYSHVTTAAPRQAHGPGRKQSPGSRPRSAEPAPHSAASGLRLWELNGALAGTSKEQSERKGSLNCGRLGVVAPQITSEYSGMVRGGGVQAPRGKGKSLEVGGLPEALNAVSSTA